MKKLLALTLLAFSGFAFANTCNMVVPFPPGGGSDAWARALQRSNPKIQIEYKPGAFSAVAVSYLEQNLDHFIIAVPNMYTAQNPNKFITAELLQILFPIDLVIVTSKNLTLKDLSTGDINVGIHGFSSPHHIVGLQLKEKNPRINLVPLGSDIKALPLIINKEVDVYITSSTTASQWMKSFDSVKEIVKIPFNKEVKSEGFTLSSFNLFGVFVNKNSTDEQRKQILDCVKTATSNPQYIEDMKKMNINPNNIFGEEKNRLLEKHINLYKKYNL